MPVHSAATYLSNVDPGHLMLAASTIAGATYAKARAGGRKCTWERDWAGKMIMIVAPPTSTILSLIDYLLHLPRPPQILLLPPYSSPLPDELLTLLNTIRLTLTNPLAQLHCDALPRTPVGVRDFVSKWGKVEQGATGEGGRRIDAIVLGSGWEVVSTPIPKPTPSSSQTLDDSKKQRQWTIHEYHYHFVTSLIPALLRQPPERNIRLISLLSPTYSTALPTLQGKPPKVDSTMQISGAKSITTMLLNNHVQLILDILSAAALKKVKPVPNPVEEEKGLKTREDGVQSNIMTIGVVMPWTRDEVIRPVLGVDDSWLRWFLWILFFPIMIIFTPSPRKSIQSIIYALQAPVRYGTLDLTVKPLDPVSEPGAKGKKSKDDSAVSGDPRRSAVGAGDIVRDCSVADMPPVLSDPALCKITYEALEKEVEKGVRDDAKREKAFGN